MTAKNSSQLVCASFKNAARYTISVTITKDLVMLASVIEIIMPVEAMGSEKRQGYTPFQGDH